MLEPLPRDRLIALPLIPPEPVATSPTWHGWSPVAALPKSANPDSPEPLEPQGAYRDATPDEDVRLPRLAGDAARPVELLAPAGGPDAAFAAFHFGADAIYLGLKKFSARAEAENFTLEEVDE